MKAITKKNDIGKTIGMLMLALGLCACGGDTPRGVPPKALYYPNGVVCSLQWDGDSDNKLRREYYSDGVLKCEKGVVDGKAVPAPKRSLTLQRDTARLGDTVGYKLIHDPGEYDIESTVNGGYFLHDTLSRQFDGFMVLTRRGRVMLNSVITSADKRMQTGVSAFIIVK